MAHTKWVETILEQCKLLKNVLRDHTYLEQSIELANKMGITLNESNILRLLQRVLSFQIKMF